MYIITAVIEEHYTLYERTYTIEADNIKEALEQIKGLNKVVYIYNEPTVKKQEYKPDRLNNYNNAPINTEMKEIDKIKLTLKENNIRFFAGASVEVLRKKLIENNLTIKSGI